LDYFDIFWTILGDFGSFVNALKKNKEKFGWNGVENFR